MHIGVVSDRASLPLFDKKTLFIIELIHSLVLLDKAIRKISKGQWEYEKSWKDVLGMVADWGQLAIKCDILSQLLSYNCQKDIISDIKLTSMKSLKLRLARKVVI